MAAYFDRPDEVLGETAPVLAELVGRVRTEYAMDEVFDGKDEVRFRRGGKTLLTLYFHQGYFTFLIIFGRAEREAFEHLRPEFPEDFCAFYDAASTCHDGKWLFYDVRVGADVDMLMRLVHIKKKPNRKPEKLADAVIGVCGNRCDLCTLHRDHFDPAAFMEGEKHCYFTADEPPIDHSSHACPGCTEEKQCAYRRCAVEKGLGSCGECDFERCRTEHFTEPGRCNLGITADEVSRFILPYCGKERFRAIRAARREKAASDTFGGLKDESIYL